MDPAVGEQGPINRRLRNLLQTHLKQLEPELLHPEPNAVLIEQGDVADSLLLLQQGRLTIEIHQNGNPSRTIAEVGEGSVLGEMALFGIGETRHSARVRVVDAAVKILLSVPSCTWVSRPITASQAGWVAASAMRP